MLDGETAIAVVILLPLSSTSCDLLKVRILQNTKRDELLIEQFIYILRNMKLKGKEKSIHSLI